MKTLDEEVLELRRDKEELLEAIRLTQEYVQLPALPGWSWYDAYRRHRPEDAERLREYWERWNKVPGNR